MCGQLSPCCHQISTLTCAPRFSYIMTPNSVLVHPMRFSPKPSRPLPLLCGFLRLVVVVGGGGGGVLTLQDYPVKKRIDLFPTLVCVLSRLLPNTPARLASLATERDRHTNSHCAFRLHLFRAARNYRKRQTHK